MNSENDLPDIQTRRSGLTWFYYLLALVILLQLAIRIADGLGLIDLSGIDPAWQSLIGTHNDKNLYIWIGALAFGLLMAFGMKPLIRRRYERGLIAKLQEWHSTGAYPAVTERRYRTKDQWRRDRVRMYALGYHEMPGVYRGNVGIIVSWSR